MKEVKEYRIAHAETYDALVAIVNDMIKQGWQPLGGINSNVWQTPDKKLKGSNEQAMVKY